MEIPNILFPTSKNRLTDDSALQWHGLDSDSQRLRETQPFGPQAGPLQSGEPAPGRAPGFNGVRDS